MFTVSTHTVQSCWLFIFLIRFTRCRTKRKYKLCNCERAVVWRVQVDANIVGEQIDLYFKRIKKRKFTRKLAILLNILFYWLITQDNSISGKLMKSEKLGLYCTTTFYFEKNPKKNEMPTYTRKNVRYLLLYDYVET